MTSSNDHDHDLDDTQRYDYNNHNHDRHHQHQPNPSMSSMSSDVNLFGFEEDPANVSSVSTPTSIVSKQSTPVFGKRIARFEAFREDGGAPSPKSFA